MKITFTSARNDFAQQAFSELTKLYGQQPIADCDVVVALGGDGHVLHALYDAIHHGKPIFAMRRTNSVGFMCNEYKTNDLQERLQAAQKVILHPLHLAAETVDGHKKEALAINEVTILRETQQSARLAITVDGVERIAQYSGDGILVSTPAGSTAYNRSCGGPIMPLDANTLVMTAISGYRPRRWSYAVLPQDSEIAITALETTKRPVRIEAGSAVIHNAARATVRLDRTKNLALLFDPDQHLGERIIREQFML